MRLDRSVEVTPQVLNWVQVWRAGREVKQRNTVIGRTSTGGQYTIVVPLREERDLPDSSSIMASQVAERVQE